MKTDVIKILKKKDMEIAKLRNTIETLKEQLMKLEVENKKLKEERT